MTYFPSRPDYQGQKGKLTISQSTTVQDGHFVIPNGKHFALKIVGTLTGPTPKAKVEVGTVVRGEGFATLGFVADPATPANDLEITLEAAKVLPIPEGALLEALRASPAFRLVFSPVQTENLELVLLESP